MSDETSAEVSKASSTNAPVLIAPLRCPYYPGTGAASIAPFHALAASTAGLPVISDQEHVPAAICAMARPGQFRAHGNRGPPVAYMS